MIHAPIDKSLFHVEHIAIAAPAAGAVITYTMPSLLPTEIMYLRFSLTTDATVANRYVFLEFYDFAINRYYHYIHYTQTASLSVVYHLYRGSQHNVLSTLLNGQIVSNLGIDQRFPSLTLLNIDATNLQAGDQFGTTEAWLELNTLSSST